MIDISELPPGKKVYFASDFHLGAPNHSQSLEREKIIVRWLSLIQNDAQALFLVGDVFDFWFEYKHTIPKGYIRLLGKLAEIADSGIPIYMFMGNHDMWMFDYFKFQLGTQIYEHPIPVVINGKRMLVGHGDGLGPKDSVYKILKKFFRSSLCQWLFARIHPNLGMSIAQTWSRHSRKKGIEKDSHFFGEEEHLYQYCKELANEYDAFIFGHRHLPIKMRVGENSVYYNLGEWLTYNSYGVFEGRGFQLKAFEKELVCQS